MISRKGKVDGFWLFLIGVCVVLPMVRMISNEKETEVSPTTDITVKTVSIKRGVVEIINDRGTVSINTSVKIPIEKNTLRGTITSPDGEKTKAVIKSKNIITSFDKTGDWDVDMYDKNGRTIGWFKITVY